MEPRWNLGEQPGTFTPLFRVQASPRESGYVTAQGYEILQAHRRAPTEAISRSKSTHKIEAGGFKLVAPTLGPLSIPSSLRVRTPHP